MDSVLIVILVLAFTCTMEVRGKRNHHWDWDDWEYDKCPTNDYCSFYSDECNSDKGWDVRCHKCSIFQSCMKDAKNVMDPCDDEYVCKDIEAFKQGVGTFALLIIMSILVVTLTVSLCCMCKKASGLDDKLGKANNRPTKSRITTVYPVTDNAWTYNPRDTSRDIASPPPRYEEHVAFENVRLPAATTQTPPPSILGHNGRFHNNAPTATAGVHMNQQPPDISNGIHTDKDGYHYKK